MEFIKANIFFNFHMNDLPITNHIFVRNCLCVSYLDISNNVFFLNLYKVQIVIPWSQQFQTYHTFHILLLCLFICFLLSSRFQNCEKLIISMHWIYNPYELGLIRFYQLKVQNIVHLQIVKLFLPHCVCIFYIIIHESPRHQLRIYLKTLLRLNNENKKYKNSDDSQ